MEKILGVIGGMGPLATIQFYQNITNKTIAEKDQDHVRMIILNHSSLRDRTEAILAGDTTQLYKDLLEDAKYLVQGGATAIAIPCNTANYFVPLLAEEIDVPIINMITESVNEVKKKFVSGRVGLLATDGTLKVGHYQKTLKDEGIEPYLLSAKTQKSLMGIIYNEIKAGKRGSVKTFNAIEKELKEAGCVGVLLACTELSVYRQQENLGDFYIDAMSVLENKAIRLIKE